MITWNRGYLQMYFYFFLLIVFALFLSPSKEVEALEINDANMFCVDNKGPLGESFDIQTFAVMVLIQTNYGLSGSRTNNAIIIFKNQLTLMVKFPKNKEWDIVIGLILIVVVGVKVLGWANMVQKA